MFYSISIASFELSERKAYLLTVSEIDLEQFVSSFFEIERRHDREVDGTL